MAKRGYKLQEFVAHAGNVNCLTFGKKNCRVFITGGDDQKVNLWSVGKPTSLMSLCGHTSPIESAAFDASEVLVVAGSSSGAIKLWDLEETKMVRTLTGHRSYCTAVEFHPFGEFFASGSMDTNLKIWDIRKKGCIHTYKGHTRGISTIRFTPDGRWVVSGGFDNVVKIWDLTAGKPLHDFKFHEGHIRSIEFHPLEFLLATGSADKTVKFWDLETFEMIGSARREATGVRSLTFHPDGRTLFCGLDDSLKVYSWEPVICHDSVDMGWSTVGDLCVHDGKLLGGAYYENSVAVWVADVSLMEPYGTRSAPEPHSQSEQKCESQGSLLEKEESHVKSKSNLRATTPDSESKEIKTIYVDRVNSITSKTVDTIEILKVVQPADSSEISSIGVQKRGSVASLPSSDSIETGATRTQKRAPVSSFPSSDSKEISSGGIQKRAPVSSLPSSDSKEISTAGIQKHAPVSSLPLSDPKDISAAGIKKGAPVSNLPSSDSKEIISTVIQKRAPVSSLPPSDSKQVSTTGNQKHGPVPSLPPSDSKEIRTTRIQKRGPGASFSSKANVPAINRSLVMPSIVPRDSPDGKYSVGSRRESIASAKTVSSINAKPSHTRRLSGSQFDMRRMSESFDSVPSDNMKTPLVIRKDSNVRNRLVTDDNAKESSEGKQSNNNTDVDKIDRTSLPATTSMDQSLNSNKRMNPVKVVNGVAVVHGRTRSLVEKFEKKDKLDVDEVCTPDAPDRASSVAVEPVGTPPSQQGSDQKIVAREQLTSDVNTSNLIMQQSSDQKVGLREQLSLDDNNIIENLMQNHDVLLSTFRSRLTKLQVVRHFWERNDVKGAINAVRKLPDYSMQADVVGALTERMEVFTLELFSCLLPVLYGLLESKTERHATLSLEMLLKLVAVFGSLVNSAVSAPPSVGVDLHAEERIECCRKCFDHLQNIQRALPELVRRGGIVARCAQQLNMVLQQT